MLFRAVVSILFCFSLFLKLNAQQYNFRNYSVADGLPQSQVYALAEDTLGYLWMGTRGGGVCRFDGQVFKSYTEEDGLPGNFVRCITVADNGTIWVGTDEGLAKFDGQQFSIIPLPGQVGLVNALLATDKELWVATEDTGVVVFVNDNIKAHYYYKNGLPSDRAHGLLRDPDGTIWIGTENGLVRIQNERSTIFGLREGLGGSSIRSIARDEQKILWLATYGDGLYRLDPDSNRFVQFDQRDGLPNETVHCLMRDDNGYLWVATASGVARIKKQNDRYTVNIFSEREGLCSNVAMCLLADSWGNIWFGTSGGGACRLDGERFIHFNEKSGNMGTWVYAVQSDRKGHIWFGTSSGGVTEYDGYYYTNYYEGAGFTTSKVRCIHEDTAGNLWFGTVGDGAYLLHDGTFRHFTRKDGLTGNFVNDIVMDKSGQIWFATAGGGLCRYDPLKDKFTSIDKSYGVFADRFFQICLDKSGKLWAGSQNGVFVFQYDSNFTKKINHFTTKNGLPNDIARAIKCDMNGIIWVGTAGGGISRYNNGSFSNFTKQNGLASNNIYLLQPDESGQLWVGTERGLDRLQFTAQGKFKTVKHYGKGEGLSGIEVSINASCSDTAGNLWFGTIYGATRYNPLLDKDNKTPPRVHITGIRLFFDPITSTPYANSSNRNWFGLPDSLELPYTQNALRFEFTGIDLQNPDGVRFRWQLRGFDKSMSPANTERQATYSNLPPGEYYFVVQACNADGYWSKEQIFHFRITPPFWDTWLFRIVTGLLIALLIIILFRWRVNRIKRRNRARLTQLKLEKHLLELEQKALRLQMNPHFIFNALQSIQGFIARNDSVEARRYLAKFGKLMRITLDNSRQPYTSVALEAEMLQHYLELEALCTGNKFTFSIDQSLVPDPEATYLPVMLIQPFAENAVMHGVYHRESGGHIQIQFALEHGALVCKVEDNGVGRQKAAEIEHTSHRKHQSAAMDITRERLEQLNEVGKPKSHFIISDLNPGTSVTIQIGAVVVES